ncbi:alpha/beta fold hydrolase [Streptomyces sp. CG1]|uniref:alpha/beta fold hydrolase n=1 Tax=Streptomyces sp. CG1 TaxID=1287523 RepID=UPI0034E19855
MFEDPLDGLPDQFVERFTSTVTQREADTKRHLAHPCLLLPLPVSSHSGRHARRRRSGPICESMATLMDALGYQRFAVIGHDTGMPIAYALAADHPEPVARLAVAEAFLPAVTSLPPLVGTEQANNRLWHIPVNRLTNVNEKLVRGREDIYFGWQFATKAVQKLPGHVVDYYVRMLASQPDALRGSFGRYRALDTTSAQDQQRRARPLTLPVLAIGGAGGLGESVAGTMRLGARDVRGVVIPGSGHWVAEEAPQEVLAALTTFLAPYREQEGSRRPPATAMPGK